MSSIQGSRESSLPRNFNSPEYWNMNPQYPVQPQFNSSFGSVQPMFHTAPDITQHNNLMDMK